MQNRPPQPPPPPLNASPQPLKHPAVWVSSTYFAEGFPYSIVNTMAEVLFKELGASLEAIGLTSLFHLPWNIKFLWGPFLDAFGTKRGWLIGIEVALCLVLVALGLAAETSMALTAASVLFVLLAFLSATHDIAIDGYYLEALDKDGQGRWVGLRAAAYRVAMFVVSSPLLLLVAWVRETHGAGGWLAGMLAAAGIMGLLLLYHASMLPRAETARQPVSALLKAVLTARTALVGLALLAVGLGLRELAKSEEAAAAWAAALAAVPTLAKVSAAEWIALTLLGGLLALALSLGRIRRWMEGRDSFYVSAFVDFLDQPRLGAMLGFILLFRVGESFLLKMRYAFLRDIGMSMEGFALASGTFGLFASMGATILGGWLIGRYGLRRCIWPFMVAQNFLNLLYMWLAAHAKALGGPVPFETMTTIITVEAAGAGLGTAVFMVYLMRCCKPAYKAAHMAILTALMSLGFTVAGVASGFLAAWLGYTRYFGLTFLVTVPAMLLVFVIPYLDEGADQKATR